MKKIIFSLALFCAFALPSFGQFIPGPPLDELPGLPPSCTSDLYIANIGGIPQSAPAGSTISFPVEVRNKVECNTPATVLRVQIEYLPFQFHYVNVTVPPFSAYADRHVVMVNYTVPTFLQGSPIYIGSFEVDATNVVTESNENNNRVFSFNQVVIY